jgi:hypothetical protein
MKYLLISRLGLPSALIFSQFSNLPKFISTQFVVELCLHYVAPASDGHLRLQI